MKRAWIRLTPGLNEDRVHRALEEGFGRKYQVIWLDFSKVTERGRHGQPIEFYTWREVLVRRNAWRAIRVRLIDNKIEISGAWGLSWVDGLHFLRFLLIPTLITSRLHESAWQEMGEEVTRFLESRYGPRIAAWVGQKSIDPSS